MKKQNLNLILISKKKIMTKNQKMLLGVAILGVGGYLYWNSTKTKKTAGFVAYKRGCPCQGAPIGSFTDSWGRKHVTCKGGQSCCVEGTAEHPCPTFGSW